MALLRDYQGKPVQKGKTSLDFTEARDSEWQWHQLGHMQVCTSLQTDNHTSTPPLSFLQAGCPSCRPTNSVKALKAYLDVVGVLERRQAVDVLRVVVLDEDRMTGVETAVRVRPLPLPETHRDALDLRIRRE